MPLMLPLKNVLAVLKWPLALVSVFYITIGYSESPGAASTNRESLFDIAKVERSKPENVGVAKDIATGEVLYNEYHYSSLTDGFHYVIYRDATGKLIAEKQLIFSKQAKRPELKQYNYLSGESVLIAGNAEAEESLSSFVVQYKESFSAKQQRQLIANQPDLVIDSGFAFLIAEHWDALQDEEPFEFDYLAPSRQRAFNFTLQQIDCHGKNGSNNQLHRCFQIAPKSWWLQRFLAPIDLTYDIATKRLIKYAGLGNIADVGGDYMKVVIDYSYLD